MILRAVVALLTSLSLVLTPLAYASALPATAAMQVSPDAADDDAWLSPGDVVDAGLTGGERYFAHEYDKNFLDLLKSNDPDDFDDIRRQAVKNGLDRDRLGLLNKVSDVAELGEFAMHLKQEEWTKAGEMALSTLLDSPPATLTPENVQAYNQAVAARLRGTGMDGFVPTLDKLDKMMSSIQVAGGAVEPTTPGMPRTGSAQDSTWLLLAAVVTFVTARLHD